MRYEWHVDMMGTSFFFPINQDEISLRRACAVPLPFKDDRNEVQAEYVPQSTLLVT